MNHFRDEGQRLQRARAELFEQQQLRKITEFAFVSNDEDGSEALEVYVRDSNVMACRNDKMASFLKCRYRLLTNDVQ